MATRRRFVQSTAALTSAGVLSSFAGCSSDTTEETTTTSSGDTDATTTESAPEDYSFLLGSLFPDGHIIVETGKRWAQAVETETDGRIKVSIKPSFGSEEEVTQQTGIGAIDGSLLGVLWVKQYAPELFWLETPFVFDGWNQKKRAFQQSDYGAQLRTILKEKANQQLIGDGIFQGDRLLTANRAIESPDDLNGIKMRVPGLDSWQESWNGLGANATSIAFDELYSALQQGVVNAQENPATTLKSMSINEVQSHVMLTKHLPQDGWVSFNLDTWNELSADDQDLLSTTLKAEIKTTNENAVAQQEAILDELADKGMNIVNVDQAAWFDAATPILEQMWADKGWSGSVADARSI